MARSPTKDKNKRNDYKAWTLSDKLEVIIVMRERGLTWVKIAQDKNMHEATARSIYKEKDKIRDQGFQLKKS